jgi:2-methylcitrate dehydratase
MSDRYSRLFARYAAGVDTEGLPPATVHEIRRRILDSIGVAAAGFDEDATVAARRYAAGAGDGAMTHGAPGGGAGATLWGTRDPAGVEAAGFANGVAVRCLDFNDTYLSLEPLHPSDVIPPLMALAEARGIAPRELFAGIAVAYELGVDLCDAASLRVHGWDHVNYIAVGVAAGAGRMLGLDAGGIEHAISIASVPHAAMRQTRVGELSMWKGAAAANASRNALAAALLAEAGMTGPFHPFDGEMGFVAQLLDGQPFDDAPFAGLEATAPPSRILDTYIKFWPVEYHAQSAVDAALQLRAELGGTLEGVEHIHIGTFGAAYQIIAKDPQKWDPKTRETADHSLQYIVVAALEDGEVTQATFDLERIRRPATLHRLQHEVSLDEDPELSAGYPDGIPNRIVVTRADGTQLLREVRHPRGHAKNPMTDDEVTAKYRANAAGRWSDARTGRVADLVWSLDAAGSVDELVAAMGAD